MSGGRFGVGDQLLPVASVLRGSQTFANRKESCMKTTTKAMRRSLYSVFAAAGAGGAAVAGLSLLAGPSGYRRTGPLRSQ